jgi:hypothetical protein
MELRGHRARRDKVILEVMRPPTTDSPPVEVVVPAELEAMPVVITVVMVVPVWH